MQTIFTAVFWLMLAFIPFIISTHLPSTGSWRAYGDPSYLSIFPYLSDLWLTGFSIWEQTSSQTGFSRNKVLRRPRGAVFFVMSPFL